MKLHTEVLKIIPMQPERDLEEIYHIEQVSFPDPWKPADFEKVLGVGMFAGTPSMRRGQGTIATHSGRIVGYTIITPYQGDTQSIETLAVCLDRRREGIGRALVSAVQRGCRAAGRARVQVLVRETNLPALCLFRACGFVAERIEKDFYDTTDEDGIVMVWRVEWDG
jgi:ribosomal-protein-alanine N-acetyltransferase